jgi:hypothetical protein
VSFLAQRESELPPVSNFEQIDFAQPTVVYDRTGTVVLARFQIERRRVVAYDAIPKVLLDATIAVEDRTFWDNEGYDPNARLGPRGHHRGGRPGRLDHRSSSSASVCSSLSWWRTGPRIERVKGDPPARNPPAPTRAMCERNAS